MRAVWEESFDHLSTEELFDRYAQTHEQAIKWEIALRHTNLVKSIALQIRGVFCSFAQIDDIVNEGLIVLAEAVDKYDPQRGRFDLYVAKRIRGMTVDIARRQDWVPRTVRQRAQKIEKIMTETYHATGQFPSDEDVAGQLEISMQAYQEALASTSLHNVLSLEELFENYDHFSAKPDAGQASGTPEQSLIGEELLDTLKGAIASLKDSEQMVLSLYYEHDLKMKDIAQLLQISAPRVSQIHARAIQKLRLIIEQYLNNESA